MHVVNTSQGPSQWKRTVVLDLEEEANKKVFLPVSDYGDLG